MVTLQVARRGAVFRAQLISAHIRKMVSRPSEDVELAARARDELLIWDCRSMTVMVMATNLQMGCAASGAAGVSEAITSSTATLTARALVAARLGVTDKKHIMLITLEAWWATSSDLMLREDRSTWRVILFG